jgi:hypothetical protein
MPLGITRIWVYALAAINCTRVSCRRTIASLATARIRPQLSCKRPLRTARISAQGNGVDLDQAAGLIDADGGCEHIRFDQGRNAENFTGIEVADEIFLLVIGIVLAGDNVIIGSGAFDEEKQLRSRRVVFDDISPWL